jgi:hypothetical protein
MRQIKNNASREFDPSLLGTDRGRHSLKKEKRQKQKQTYITQMGADRVQKIGRSLFTSPSNVATHTLID